MVTIDAASLSSRYGSAASTMRTEPIRSMPKHLAQFSSVSGVAIALTFATRMSIPPRAAADSATHAARATPSATSTAEPTTVLPEDPSSAWVTVTASRPRAQNATEAPSSRRVSTTARPIPLVPPVTSARKPARCRSIPVAFPSMGAECVATGPASSGEPDPNVEHGVEDIDDDVGDDDEGRGQQDKAD